MLSTWNLSRLQVARALVSLKPNDVREVGDMTSCSSPTSPDANNRRRLTAARAMNDRGCAGSVDMAYELFTKTSLGGNAGPSTDDR
jgi:hypothetical protein